MGMDTVELVLAVEDRFTVSIPDHIASTLTTVGKLNSWLMEELHRLDRAQPPDVIFDQLRALIVSYLNVSPDEVIPDARFVEDLGAE